MNRVEHLTHAEHMALESGYTRAEVIRGDADSFKIGVLAVTCEQADDTIADLKRQLKEKDIEIAQLEIECDSLRSTLCEVEARY